MIEWGIYVGVITYTGFIWVREIWMDNDISVSNSDIMAFL